MKKKEVLAAIENKTIHVGVVGLGYVGLPLAVEKAKAGFKTTGFDVQKSKVDMVNAGHNYIGDVVQEDLEKLVKDGMLKATSDFTFVKDCDFIAICVPTPLDRHQQPDISFVRDSTIAISKHLKKDTMVVLESTTYPGTTEELVKPILEEGSGLKCGEDFYLGFSPERVDPGNLIYKTKNTPKVVGAIGSDAAECIGAMYRAVLSSEVTIVSSPAVAEMEKILENTYRNINNTASVGLRFNTADRSLSIAADARYVRSDQLRDERFPASYSQPLAYEQLSPWLSLNYMKNAFSLNVSYSEKSIIFTARSAAVASRFCSIALRAVSVIRGVTHPVNVAMSRSVNPARCRTGRAPPRRALPANNDVGQLFIS